MADEKLIPPQFLLFESESEVERVAEGVAAKPPNLPSGFGLLCWNPSWVSPWETSAARPIGMSVLRPGQENRAFDVLKRKFYCSGGRSKVGEGFENWGLKIFSTAESEKPRW